MLTWLMGELIALDSGFAVFQYITLRGILAAVTAMLISLWVGPWMIRRLDRMQIGQAVREDGPESHLVKSGTPTMGGALILVAIVAGSLLWGSLDSRYLWVAVLTTLAFGAIGWVDDYRKVVERDSRGLPARWKYFWQSLVGFAAAAFLYTSAAIPAETNLYVPFFKDVALPLGLLFVPFAYLVIVGSSNAVNLTDGLDGLAIGPGQINNGGVGDVQSGLGVADRGVAKGLYGNRLIDLKLGQVSTAVAEMPSVQVDRRCGRIEDLDEAIPGTCRVHFVDHQARSGRC